jgi:hypothetical protein
MRGMRVYLRPATPDESALFTILLRKTRSALEACGQTRRCYPVAHKALRMKGNLEADIGAGTSLRLCESTLGGVRALLEQQKLKIPKVCRPPPER